MLVSRETASAHFKSRHSRCEILLVCHQCRKCFKKQGNVIRHYAQCASRAVPLVHCLDCDKSFATHAGLSAHVTHEHRPRESPPGGLRTTALWTGAELRLLLRLSKQFADHKSINTVLARYLPNQSVKQIRYKRAQQSFQNVLQEQWPALSALTDEELAGLQDPSSTDPPHATLGVKRKLQMDSEQVAASPPRKQGRQSDRPEVPSKWQQRYRDLLAQWRGTGDRKLDVVLGPLRLEQSQEAIDAAYDEFIKVLGPGTSVQDKRGDQAKKSRKRNRRRKTDSKLQSARRKQAYEYGRMQTKFTSSPDELAKAVIANRDPLERAANRVARAPLKQLYDELWGQRVLGCSLPSVDAPFETHPKHFLLPMQAAEIKMRLDNMKRTTASGLDNIRKAMVSPDSVLEGLAFLFNTLLLAGCVPKAWLENRTTLIPKPGRDTTKAENYRPITVSSIVSRLFWGVVDSRLRMVINLSPRQKGFVAEAGCFNNVLLLKEALRAMTHARRGIIIQLDITKAFDIIPHELIAHALTAKGVPQFFASFVQRTYENVHTTINHKEGPIRVQFSRGVKQGDPLSPLLFALLLDPLLDQLNNLHGYKHLGVSLNVLAFADDLILLATTTKEATDLLFTTETYLQSLGMGLSPTKSVAFQFGPTGGTWSVTDPNLRLRNGRIPFLELSDKMTYLGASIGHDGKSSAKQLELELTAVLERLHTLPLKGKQRFQLVKDYVLPHFYHALTLSEVTRTHLLELDKIVRTSVKRWLHLPITYPTAVLHVSPKDGGLGLPVLGSLIPRLQLQLYSRATENEDPALIAAFRAGGVRTRCQQLALSLHCPWPITRPTALWLASKQDQDRLKQYHELGTTSMPQCRKNDKFGNKPLARPQLLSSRDFKLFLLALGGTVPTNVVLKRAGDTARNENCRLCHETKESVGHIIGGCQVNLPQRVARHDKVCEMVIERITNLTAVLEPVVREQAYEMRNNLGQKYVRKPDWVFLLDNDLLICDVTVRMEKPGYERTAAKEKRSKYEDDGFYKVLKRRYGEHLQPRVVPLVFGAFGAVPQSTLAALLSIHPNLAKKSFVQMISLTVLKRSLLILRGTVEQAGPTRKKKREKTRPRQ
ncbi:Hypothetical predicted protein [Cloeon dipterum]|uniref:Reverse transcriptase domain-containing protein n=1 Tax=Cloeon dipterum TaxID=197152 RepID=A0A8S1DWS1_9INSE|nr:Hypothetical predicted protein [Cloeon dipterum]